MQQTTQLARIMRLSWDIQRKRKLSRAKSLLSAWAIMQNEETTVYYLVQMHRAGGPCQTSTMAWTI